MAKASLALIPPARTPERQRLADAIAERDRRLALVAAKRAEIEALNEPRYALWGQRDDLESEVRRLQSGRTNDAARREALLRGEEIPPENDIDAVRAKLADVNDELARSAKAEAELKNDIHLLSTACDMSDGDVAGAVKAVLLADPARSALIAELERLMPRVTQLRRAAWNTFGSDIADRYNPADAVRGPCPWQTASDRLASDPDARLPMPEDVFAEPQTRPAA